MKNKIKKTMFARPIMLKIIELAQIKKIKIENLKYNDVIEFIKNKY